MVKTEVSPEHFFIGEEGGGNCEVIVHDNRAFIYELNGDGQADLFSIFAEVERLVRGMGVTDVYLHTGPGTERMEGVYEMRYGFKRLHVVWHRSLEVAS